MIDNVTTTDPGPAADTPPATGDGPAAAMARLLALRDAAGEHLRRLAAVALDRARRHEAPAAAAAVDELLRRIDEASALLAADAPEADVDTAFGAVFDAISDAREAALRSGLAIGAELDELPLKTATRAWSSIKHLQRELRAGWVSEAVALDGAEFELQFVVDDAAEAERDVIEGVTARRVTEAAAAARLQRAAQERALSATPAGEDTCMSPPVARPAGRLFPGAEPWPMPVDLFAADDVTGRPTLRAEHAPAVLFRFAQDTAQRLGVDPAAVALAGVVALSAICSDYWRIQPKRHDTSWTEAPRLWGALVGAPSTLKSPIIAAATGPLETMERRAQHEHSQALREWQQENLGLKPELRAPLPRRTRFLIEDVTLEAVVQVLRTDPDSKFLCPARKIALRADELAQWLGAMDAYKARAGADRAAWLTAYNGGQRSVDRVKNGAILVENFSCCILGGVQPDILRRAADAAGDDGLFARFLVVQLDEPEFDADRAPDQQALDAYANLFPALLRIEPEMEGLMRRRRVVLSDEAQRRRGECQRQLLAAENGLDVSPLLRGMLGKWRNGTWARLALTYHLVALASGETAERYLLSGDTALKATRFMVDVLFPHAVRVCRMLDDSAGSQLTRRVAEMILADHLHEVTARELQRSIRGLRKPEQRAALMAAMNHLVLLGWVRPANPREHDNRVTRWTVNQAVHLTFADQRAAAAARIAERQAAVQRALGILET